MDQKGRQTGWLQMQPTLTELKRLGDETFADAQAVIAEARQIAQDCRQLNAELRQARDKFKQKQSWEMTFRAVEGGFTPD